MSEENITLDELSENTFEEIVNLEEELEENIQNDGQYDVVEHENDDTDIQEDTDKTTISQLQETILSLKEQISILENDKRIQEKVLQEVGDFASLFPSVDISSVPESVWESVKKGTSLAASYALYEKRLEAENMRISQINSINSLRSAGAAGKNTASEFFTPDDVRKMSRAEVHANFSKIKKSMEKWN